MGEPIYRIRHADLEVRPDLGCLRRLNGEEIYLRPKTFQTLLFLLENRDRVVPKDEIARQIWPDVAVTDDAVVQCIVEIRKALGDDARDARFVRTLPKAGYRFVGEIESPVPPEDGSEAVSYAPLPPPAAAPEASRRWMWVGVATIAAAVSLGAYWQVQRRSSVERAVAAAPADRSEQPKKIAVMFLENLSKTPELDWLREGLADMLATGVSRSKAVAAIDRRQFEVLLNRIGHEDGAPVALTEAVEVARRARLDQFVLGAFSKLGNAIRIDLRLYEGSGRLVTTEGLTIEKADDLLAEVDLLAWRLVRDLGGEPSGTKAATTLTTNLQAYRYYSLGLTKANAYHHKEAVELFTRATELDPRFAMAYARIGYTYGVTTNEVERARPYLERAYALADRLTEKDRLNVQAWNALAHLDYEAAASAFADIVRFDPTDVEAYMRLGVVLAGERRYDEALSAYRRGLAVDPESTGLWNQLGGLYGEMGRDADSIAARRKYVALDPQEPNAYDSLGLSLQSAGRHEEAVAAFGRALELKPDFEVALIHRGHTYAQMGRYRAAEEAYRQYLGVASSDQERMRAYHSLAFLAERAGRTTQAIGFAKRASRLPVFLPFEVVTRARAGEPVDRFVQQLGDADTAASRGSRVGRRPWMYARGVIALKQGKSSEALEHFRAALAERAIFWDADLLEDCVANAYLQLARPDDAIAEYRRILTVRPWYPLAQYHLGQALEHKGETAAAHQAYATFLELWKGADPDIPEVRIARTRVATQ